MKVTISSGNLDGKGVYADKDFLEGEVVIQYSLKLLSEEEYAKLPEGEKKFVHSHKGQLMLYSEPERYVNHSDTPNTFQNLETLQDIALRGIKKGEMITTDSLSDDM